MINGKYNAVVRNLIIDVAPYGNGFEIMVMKRNGTEVESASAKTEFEAANIFEDFIRKYDVLTGKYAKLRDDIRDALLIAEAAVMKIPDNGTCNFDAPIICLPRWKEKDVLRAASEAGTSAFKLGTGLFLIHTPPVGMAWRNTVAAHEMAESLKAKGYAARVFYRID